MKIPSLLCLKNTYKNLLKAGMALGILSSLFSIQFSMRENFRRNSSQKPWEEWTHRSAHASPVPGEGKSLQERGERERERERERVLSFYEIFFYTFSNEFLPNYINAFQEIISLLTKFIQIYRNIHTVTNTHTHIYT